MRRARWRKPAGAVRATADLVVSRGGLAVIGSERHESRRIDNQLRGRSGRQGDPGQSRFYVALQDELMRLFGPERFDFLLRGWEEHEPIAARMISRQIESAQKKVEGHNFEMRQHVLKYDDVMNHQRKVIYEQRRRVLEGDDMQATVREAVTQAVDRRVDEFAGEATPDQWDIEALSRSLLEVCPQLPVLFSPPELHHGPENPLFEQQYLQRVWTVYQLALRQQQSTADLRVLVQAHVDEAYAQHEESQGEENMRLIERMVIMRIVDHKWISHLDAMDFLREGISLRGYAQVDPLVAYTSEAFEMWNLLMREIQEEVAQNIFRVRLVSESEQYQRSSRRRVNTNRSDEGPKSGDRVAHANVRANDPCPCGSGLKYKKCCMNK